MCFLCYVSSRDPHLTEFNLLISKFPSEQIWFDSEVNWNKYFAFKDPNKISLYLQGLKWPVCLFLTDKNILLMTTISLMHLER